MPEPTLCRTCWHDETQHDSENHWVCTARTTSGTPCECASFDDRDEDQ